jgi:hypothetical protein
MAHLGAKLGVAIAPSRREATGSAPANRINVNTGSTIESFTTGDQADLNESPPLQPLLRAAVVPLSEAAG